MDLLNIDERTTLADFEAFNTLGAKIIVMGIGGGGCNAIDRMYESFSSDIKFIAVNTDAQALERCKVPNKIQIGKNTTGGKGSGAKPWIGQKAALESLEEIKAAIADADILFLSAGMGGGTGTGAISIIAKTAVDMGILTISVVTLPFFFEGKKRKLYADTGIGFLEEASDSLVVIPNENLMSTVDHEVKLLDAFSMVDDILRRGVQGIASLILDYGIINVDFADVKTILRNKGMTYLSVGTSEGENRLEDALKLTMKNPLIDATIKDSTSILLYIAGGHDLGIQQVYEIAERVRAEANPEANIVFGASCEEDLNNKISITLIATGFSEPLDEEDLKEEEKETIETTENSEASEELIASETIVEDQLLEPVESTEVSESQETTGETEKALSEKPTEEPVKTPPKKASRFSRLF